MLDRKTVLIYVALGTIGAILLIVIFGSFAGIALTSAYGKFQVQFVGKVLKFTVTNADRVLAIAQNTVTSIGKTTLSTISITASTVAAMQKTLFELTFFVANQVGVVVEGAITSIKELLEILTRLTEKVVNLVATFSKTAIDIVSRAMKSTVRMISKSVESVKTFATEVFVPALRKTFKLTQEMAENVTKIMTKILPIYMEVLKTGMQVVIGGEAFTVGLYAISAYVALSISLGHAFINRIFGGNIIQLIVNTLQGVFTDILVGAVNPFSLCNLVTELVYPVLGPVVAPNIPIFGSTLKRCDRELIKLGLYIITKGKMCRKFPNAVVQAISCILGNVGNITIIPKIPSIGFSSNDLLRLAGIDSRAFGYLGGALPSISVGPFGPYTINNLLTGIADALQSYMEMSFRQFTKDMSSLSGSFGTAYKSVSFSIVNPRPSGALATQAREQTGQISSDSTTLTNSLVALSAFRPKYPELDVFLRVTILPILINMVRQIRLLGNNLLLDFNAYRNLYNSVLPDVISGTKSGDTITMPDHGYSLRNQVWIETVSNGYVKRTITEIVDREKFKIDLTDVSSIPEIFEAPETFPSTINEVEIFLLNVIRKKYITKFQVDTNDFTPSTDSFTNLVKLNGVLYGIKGTVGKVYSLVGNAWVEDILSPSDTRSLIIFDQKVYAASPAGVFIRNSGWVKITGTGDSYSLCFLDPDRLIIGSAGSVDVYSRLSQGLTNLANDIDGNVNSIVVDPVSQTMYIGGDFLSVNGTPMNLVAGYGLTEGSWFSLRNGINETGSPGVSRLIFNSGRLLAYGSFSSLYIFNFQLNLWNGTTPSSKIVSDLTLDDGVILFCLENKTLNLLFPNSISTIFSGIELTKSGSLFQDGDSLYIGGVNRININSVRLASPTVSGFISFANGFATSSVSLFAGTALTIGTFRTTVQEVTQTGGLVLNPAPNTVLNNVPFTGRIPTILDEISSVFFANALAEYSLASNGRVISGKLNISSSSVVTSTIPDIVIGTIITTGNFRTKVVGSTGAGVLTLVPALPVSLNSTPVDFTGRIPTILSLLFDVLKLNTENSYIKISDVRSDVSAKLETLYNDFIDFTSIIPIRYLGNQTLVAENVLAANFIASTPEFILLKYRVGRVDDFKTASIDTVLRVVFRQMLSSLVRRFNEIWERELNSQVEFLKTFPDIPSRTICLVPGVKFSFKGPPKIVCLQSIDIQGVNIGDVASKVTNRVTNLIKSIANLTPSFIDSVMGPDPGSSETPAFNYD